MTNTQKMALAKQMEDFANGIALTHDSMTYVTDKGNVLEGIINGDTYAADRYVNCFTYSFEDEESELGMFAEAFAEYVDLPFIPLNRAETIELDEYEACLLGFNMAKQALEQIVALCKADKDLKKELAEFDPQSVESEEEYGTYNPFKLYGVIEFEKKFKGFRRAYLAELRQAIGEKEFLRIEEKTTPHLDETDTRKFTIKH